MTDSYLLSAAYSRYAARLYAVRPELAARVAELADAPLTREVIEQRLDAHCADARAAAGAGSGMPADAWLKAGLRRARAELFCAVMERDLRGADVGEVTGAMTDLAECAIRRALVLLSADLEAQFGVPRGVSGGPPQTLGVVGMGKLGGRELNVSSDIDLVFVYAEDGETAGGTRAPLANHEFFTRLGRRLIAMLAEITEDGYVFRVDMRLRPNGDSGPLVCSLPMLEEYFYVQGREWERYAWIKGRLVSETGSAAAQRLEQGLAALVRPFVYRRYLDFGAIGAIRALHAQIRSEAGRRAAARPERADDVKLGRGGIREIEFCAQVFQLVRGGQDVRLRLRPTLDVLAAAARQGWMAPQVAAQLRDAYLFLRRVEHRLQYVDDAQTHALPVDAAACAQLAASLGFADGAAFTDALGRQRAAVERQFDLIFADKNGTDAAAPDGRIAEIWSDALADDAEAVDLAAPLAALGFADADAVLARLRAVRRSARYHGLPPPGRARFDLLVQRALAASAALPAVDGPAVRDATLLRCVDLLETISRRGAYLALLTEYPAALQRVLAVLGGSRWAAGYLIGHPQLLDELLDDEAFASPFDWPAFKAALRARLLGADGVEQQMDLLRHAHHAEVFRILLLDLRGALTVERISDHLSALADAVLDVTLDAVWRQLPRRHRQEPRFAVIAYGKLGGKELGYASDLDLIFLYDDADDAAPDVYALLARRLISWLTTATGAGQLFDVDLRLRPNGSSGLLVTDLDGFRRYQLREGGANLAWVWEHQALSRARGCAGDAAICAAFEAIRTQVLAMPRDAAVLAREIVAMRARVLDGHPNPTALFDLKHDRGGMVDIEFVVQYLVLLHAARHPPLTANSGNIALLREAGALGLLEAAQAERVGDAYRTYRALQHKLRLDGLQAARVAPERVEAEREVVLAMWESVFGGRC